MGIKLDPGCMVGAGVNWGVRLLGKDVSWSRDAGMCVLVRGCLHSMTRLPYGKAVLYLHVTCSQT